MDGVLHTCLFFFRGMIYFLNGFDIILVVLFLYHMGNRFKNYNQINILLQK